MVRIYTPDVLIKEENKTFFRLPPFFALFNSLLTELLLSFTPGKDVMTDAMVSTSKIIKTIIYILVFQQGINTNLYK